MKLLLWLLQYDRRMREVSMVFLCHAVPTSLLILKKLQFDQQEWQETGQNTGDRREYMLLYYTVFTYLWDWGCKSYWHPSCRHESLSWVQKQVACQESTYYWYIGTSICVSISPIFCQDNMLLPSTKSQSSHCLYRLSTTEQSWSLSKHAIADHVVMIIRFSKDWSPGQKQSFKRSTYPT